MSNLEGARQSFCRMADQPKGFNEKDFRTFLKDDDALIRASKATWLLLPATATYHVNAGWCAFSIILPDRQIPPVSCVQSQSLVFERHS